MPNNPGRMYEGIDMPKEEIKYMNTAQAKKEYGLEVDESEAAELAGSGAKIFVLENDYNDAEFVQQALNAKYENVDRLDMNDVHPVLMEYGTHKELQQIGRKYEGAVIVCPHGNTSRRFAEALSKIGIKAYSLKKGITGMRSRV